MRIVSDGNWQSTRLCHDDGSPIDFGVSHVIDIDISKIVVDEFMTVTVTFNTVQLGEVTPINQKKPPRKI